MQNHIERSCFFRLRSPRKLASYLQIDLPHLEELSEKGSANYNQFECSDRWIETPQPALKKVQRRIHELLTRVPPPDFLFSAYPGRSSVQNAAFHLSGTVMAKLDIKKFYPSTDGYRVSSLFRKEFQCSMDVAAILRKLCTIEKTKNSEHCHLPTGGVTSPILAYFCYAEMFKDLAELANRNGLKMSVFADDITFSGAVMNKSIVAEAKSLLRDNFLTCHPKKEKFWSAKHGNKLVTGVLVTPKGLRVPLSRKQAILRYKEQLLGSEGPGEKAKIYQRYVGALSSAGQIEPRFAKGARCALQEWKRDERTWKAHTRMCRNTNRK